MGKDKQTLREEIRRLARANSADSEAVCQVVVSWLLARLGASVLSYLPMDGEVDLRGLHGDDRWSWHVTRTPTAGWLTIHTLEIALERHPFGFDQPLATQPEVPVAGIDLVLVPGLAFGADGTRLGHGLGYYDQLLDRCRPDTQFVGVTLERFLFPRLPVADHDVHMHWVASEIGVRKIPGRRAINRP